ncbi:MAG TPA: SpoIIE family protein phosphatase [Shinella sp.]|uniref:PP2C family protein-serine/threonine phosphatase n=1 Tax=Shinella sp. TaxID=1870904 RepID=UPI002E161850|nr:SpoIIE family protein phosphatase [Shinella sp.]
MDFSQARILIVDDIEDNRDVLARRLRRLGLVNTVQAGDGLEALEKVRAEPFDLVLLDVMMPRMNGIDALQALNDEGWLKTLSVVMISAASEIETVVRCIELGAEDYLPKPFNPALLAARVGAVLEKKFLRDINQRQLERLERELAEAWLCQQSMLPTTFPVDPAQLDIFASIDPALEIGGDLYDVFEVTPGLIALAIGDVAGKGASAALFMARTRSLLRAGTLQFHAISGRVPRPSEIVALINDELGKNNPNSRFVTLFYALLEVATGRLTYCNAGHVYPIWTSGTTVAEVATTPDPALGVIDALDFHDHELVLAVGDRLFLTSDGLSDMQNAEQEQFGTENILAEIAARPDAPATDLARSVLATAYAFAGGAPQFDDITVLVVKRLS